MGVSVNNDSIEIYNIKHAITEAIPANITRFFLENAPIVNSENEVYELEGVVFTDGENSEVIPEEFQTELVFNASKLPSLLGEYTVNYSTGEVIVVGAVEIGDGTGRKNNFASYYYRNSFTENLDYYIEDNNLVPSSGRALASESVNIDFNYDKIYIEGVDYNAPCHIEVFNEHVESNFESSFVINPTNTPVTDVFRIYNQTTGEVYQSLYHTKEQIHFFGTRSPEFKTQANELVKFGLIELERLEPIGEFVCPTFSIVITENASNNYIAFSPGIPAELIDYNSQNYFARDFGSSNDSGIEDLQIKYFGDPDSDNLINSFAINSTATTPDIGSDVNIGTKGLTFALENNMILNETQDAIGSHNNSSVLLERADLFINEKYFKAIDSNPGLSQVSTSTLESIISAEKGEDFYDNLSRLRRVGDYSVDYKNGYIYLAIEYGQEYEVGAINYRHNYVTTLNSNILNVTQAAKKLISSDIAADATRLYEKLSNTSTAASILDLENTITSYDGETTAFNLKNELQYTCEVLKDYTIVLPYDITDVMGVYSSGALEGSGLDSSEKDNRLEEFNKTNINTLRIDGGGNIYDSRYMSFSDNIINLKKVFSTRLSEVDGNFVINIDDSDFDELISAVHTPSGAEMFDDKLNILKLDNLEIASSELSTDEDEAVVSIKSGADITTVDTAGDYLIDDNGAYFKILSVDELLSIITIVSPAENDAGETLPATGDCKIIVKVETNITTSGITIKIPSDSFVNIFDPINVTYKTKSVPKIGDQVNVDARSGSIYFDYLYSYDDIYISYEYGDNEINWAISDSVQEDEDYYVTYKYGALREALRRNFGVLTKIPFFSNFGESSDREVYRSALARTMQAFTKGPTVPAFKLLVESFTDIEPNITESVFGNWILGRDHLHPNDVKYEGVLEFRPGRFEGGLMFNDDVVVNIPAVSNINLNEGTISAWIRPEWSGIDDDATITVTIDDLGVKRYNCKFNDDIFSYNDNFNVFSSEDAIGGVDSAGGSVTIQD